MAEHVSLRVPSLLTQSRSAAEVATPVNESGVCVQMPKAAGPAIETVAWHWPSAEVTTSTHEAVGSQDSEMSPGA